MLIVRVVNLKTWLYLQLSVLLSSQISNCVAASSVRVILNRVALQSDSDFFCFVYWTVHHLDS